MNIQNRQKLHLKAISHYYLSTENFRGMILWPTSWPLTLHKNTRIKALNFTPLLYYWSVCTVRARVWCDVMRCGVRPCPWVTPWSLPSFQCSGSDRRRALAQCESSISTTTTTCVHAVLAQQQTHGDITNNNNNNYYYYYYNTLQYKRHL